jgi:hypothetical protein
MLLKDSLDKRGSKSMKSIRRLINVALFAIAEWGYYIKAMPENKASYFLMWTVLGSSLLLISLLMGKDEIDTMETGVRDSKNIAAYIEENEWTICKGNIVSKNFCRFTVALVAVFVIINGFLYIKAI